MGTLTLAGTCTISRGHVYLHQNSGLCL